MTALTTHDTKRGEDVRARIAVLAEVPGRLGSEPRRAAGAGAVAGPGLRDTCCGRRASVSGRPGRLGRPRAAARVRREGDARGRRAHHLDRSRRGVRVGRARGRRCGLRRRRVRAVLDELVEPNRAAGWSNALALKLLALTMPGVPDVYQGSELERAQPGRPGQPAAGRLRRRRRQPRRRVGRQAAAHQPRRCGCGATGPSCSRRTPRCSPKGPPPTTCSPSTAAAWSRW